MEIQPGVNGCAIYPNSDGTRYVFHNIDTFDQFSFFLIGLNVILSYLYKFLIFREEGRGYIEENPEEPLEFIFKRNK